MNIKTVITCLFFILNFFFSYGQDTIYNHQLDMLLSDSIFPCINDLNENEAYMTHFKNNLAYLNYPKGIGGYKIKKKVISLEGLWKYYYCTDELWLVGSFLIIDEKMGYSVKHGVWVHYKKNGDIEKIEIYDRGILKEILPTRSH